MQYRLYCRKYKFVYNTTAYVRTTSYRNAHHMCRHHIRNNINLNYIILATVTLIAVKRTKAVRFLSLLAPLTALTACCIQTSIIIFIQSVARTLKKIKLSKFKKNEKKLFNSTFNKVNYLIFFKVKINMKFNFFNAFYY